MSYHYHIYFNITVCNVISLAHKKASQKYSWRTHLVLASGLFAFQLKKEMCYQFNSMVESCSLYHCLQGIRITLSLK